MLQEIEVVSPVDRQKQEQLLDRVDALLDDSRATQEHLYRNYLEIGIALLEVEKTRAWSLRCKSSDQYIVDCEGRFGKSRNTLYSYKSVAKNLLPHLPAQKLLEIGPSKAHPLAQYAKQKSGKLPASLVNKAFDPEVKVAEFEASVAEALHEKPDDKDWYGFLGAFYVTKEEKEEFERAIRVAREQIDFPEGAEKWEARKLVAQALVAEFLATYPSTENG